MGQVVNFTGKPHRIILRRSRPLFLLELEKLEAKRRMMETGALEDRCFYAGLNLAVEMLR